MVRVLGTSLALALLAAFASAHAHAAVDSTALCLERKLRAAGQHAKAQLACRARAVRRAQPVNPSCLLRADTRLAKAFARAERRPGCFLEGDAPDVARLGAKLAGRAASELVPTPATPSACAAKQLLAGGKRDLRVVKAHGRNARGEDLAALGAAIAEADVKLASDLAAAALRGDCQVSDTAIARGLFDSGLDSLYAALGLVRLQTLQLPSDAKPAGTPGSPGVDGNDYPKLVTLFGGDDYDLNRATYSRFYIHPAATPPDAILILIPGFQGGAMGFKPLAENLVTRALENGLRVEVWAYDRRGNQIEDRAGVAIAVAARNPQIGLDWFFGGELGLPLHSALAGLGRRAVFHGPQAESAFIANWTPLVFSRDIDAIVTAAQSVAANQNVFLGGHSAGTGFAARYAATDFDLSGLGPAEPGFAKLRGLVLLEGGGGNAGSPLSEAQLDRIEDRADGGLFAAVRDNAPRCVDGTPCTVATEAVDCAGKGKATCTSPTTAYSLVAGLLNPRILAASEPGAVQGLDDPDGGRLILQVDQGSPGNNAISVVPDLGTLAVLPAATASGALGSFIDDDGLISSLATFVRTSVGAPGPVVGGLTTWQELDEGPLPASVLPNNGPPPTSFPAGEWGQEKEVTRLDRVAATFLTEGSNFTDWYYPSSGLSTTSGISLDSSQLSVGRGRRDIENLTQAAAIDVPVIAFGGSNGLTRAPASFLAFASVIAPCAAPSCDGTPRVVDPSLPNPAFPTFGGVAGGFEVHMSEGYAHVDVITAEDDASNNVVGPLLDFLARNVQ